MTVLFRISIFCKDKIGLVSSVTGKLFDLGINLGDTTFAVLGTGAEFTSLCEAPDEISGSELESQLKSMSVLKEADISVKSFKLEQTHGPSAKVTHHILVKGGDNPGLVARLSEVFGEFEANIVRMNSEQLPGNSGKHYLIDFSVCIPENNIDACLATIENTANTLQMQCEIKSSDF